MTTPTKEIERKWLVRDLPKLTELRHERIVQGYLAISSEGAEVRVRRMGDKCVETVKSPGGSRAMKLKSRFRKSSLSRYGRRLKDDD